MIYLDYSATTKTNEEVLSSFSMASRDYFANPNSSHKLGVEANKLIEASTKQIIKPLYYDRIRYFERFAPQRATCG